MGKESSFYSSNLFHSPCYYFILNKRKLKENKPPKPPQKPSQQSTRKILQIQTKYELKRSLKGLPLYIMESLGARRKTGPGNKLYTSFTQLKTNKKKKKLHCFDSLIRLLKFNERHLIANSQDLRVFSKNLGHP